MTTTKNKKSTGGTKLKPSLLLKINFLYAINMISAAIRRYYTMAKRKIKKEFIMAPMPVLVIGTYDENGVPNAMNAAWGTQCDLDKIVIFLSKHKTTDNLQIKKAFTLAFATKETLVASDYFGIASGRNINKIEPIIKPIIALYVFEKLFFSK